MWVRLSCRPMGFFWWLVEANRSARPSCLAQIAHRALQPRSVPRLIVTKPAGSRPVQHILPVAGLSWRAMWFATSAAVRGHHVAMGGALLPGIGRRRRAPRGSSSRPWLAIQCGFSASGPSQLVAWLCWPGRPARACAGGLGVAGGTRIAPGDKALPLKGPASCSGPTTARAVRWPMLRQVRPTCRPSRSDQDYRS